MPTSHLRGFAASLACCTFALLAAAAPPAVAAPATEAALQHELIEARWPADIVSAADRYVANYPQGASASVARVTLERARQSVHALDRNVRLYRSDFQAAGASPAVGDDVRQAALADKDAALRVAHAFREGDADVNRYVGWLQFASALGSGTASYELAVHYRKADQPALAAPYEARAEEQGFKAPAALDNVRK